MSVPVATQEPIPPAPNNKRSGRVLRRSLIGGLLVLVIAGGYTAALRSFLNDSQRQGNPTVVSDGAGPDHVTISGSLIQVEPARNEATVRLVFTPEGKYATTDGSLTQNMVLKVDNATGLSDRPFDKGKAMSPSDVVVSLTDGSITDYPFDATNAVVGMYLTTAAINAVPAAGDKLAVEAVAAVPVDVNFDMQAAVHGYSVVTTPDPESSGPFAAIDLSVHRSTSTLFFSIFVMTLMWVLTLGVMAIVGPVVFLGYKIDLPILGLLAALLFAFPAVRNLQPSAPPIGSLTDFLAFFWCEALVGISLSMLIGTYIVRTLRSERVLAA